MHPGTYSSSQLSIEVSELHAGANGRLEITCLSTIPASVGPGEQYADYKTFSVKGERPGFVSIMVAARVASVDTNGYEQTFSEKGI